MVATELVRKWRRIEVGNSIGAGGGQRRRRVVSTQCGGGLDRPVHGLVRGRHVVPRKAPETNRAGCFDRDAAGSDVAQLDPLPAAYGARPSRV